MADTLQVLEPATEGVLETVPRAGVEEVDAAVARAKAALPAWAALAPGDRARLLLRVAALVEERHEDLATLEARNAGKPIGDARGEIGMVAETFRYYAGGVERNLGDTIPVAGGVAMTFREPLGVVGLITTWNFPLAIAAWKLAPALAAGNTVVLKPAELTPLTALRFEGLALEAGIPEGVVNVVVGPGRTCGTRLVEHPDVAKIAFTGSTEVGASIAAGSAQTIKRVTLELGGKSANIVFADADLERAAAAAPGATVIPFRDEAEAIRLANDTIYGLSGSIWTRNGARALRVARAIESGNLSLNSNSSVRVTTPFGGFKQSGYGRELGPHALDHYTEVKTRSEEHTSELQSPDHLVCRLLLEKKKRLRP